MINSKIVKDIWYYFCKYILILLSDETFFQIITFVNYKRLGAKWYKMNFKIPKTFNEKINYLKLYYKNPLSKVVADKVTVRKYVEKKIGKTYLVPLINIYDSVEEINFDDLPTKFALKTNHGSGWNLICNDKTKVEWYSEKKKFKSWLNKNAYYLSRENQYKHIVPRIICEELLEYEIHDYKIFCSKGDPLYIQVDKSRFSNHRRTLFNIDWKPLDISIRYPYIEGHTERPKKLNLMLELASVLSQPFTFCRVDLYEHNGNIFFGEITLHPGGGMEPFSNYKQDLSFGEVIDIKDIT